MSPITELPFPLHHSPACQPLPNDIWHPTIERVPEILAKFLNHPKINIRIDHVEFCLALRSPHEKTKRLHWCLLYVSNHLNQIPVSGLQAPFEQKEAWLVDPCAALGRNDKEFLHFLNVDALAARRLNLRTVANFHCPTPPKHWTFKDILPFIANGPGKEHLCCSVTDPGPDENSLVYSTHKWAISMLWTTPGFIVDPWKSREHAHRMLRATKLVNWEMWRVSQKELQLVAHESQLQIIKDIQRECGIGK